MLYYIILYHNTSYHVTVYCIKLYHVVIVFLPRVIAFLLDRVFCPSLLWSFTPFPTSNLLFFSFLDSTRFRVRLPLALLRSFDSCLSSCSRSRFLDFRIVVIKSERSFRVCIAIFRIKRVVRIYAIGYGTFLALGLILRNLCSFPKFPGATRFLYEVYIVGLILCISAVWFIRLFRYFYICTYVVGVSRSVY